jgi:hypothetical protein
VKTRLLVILGLLCLGLALYYIIFETPGAVAIKSQEKLFALNPGDISRIEIRGGALISLVKKGQTWWVEGQVNFPADQEEVKGLIRTLINVPVRKTLEGRKEEFGLDKPVMEMVLGTSRGRYHLSLGSDSPTSVFCYATMAGRKEVFLLPAETKALFRKSLFSLVDKYLVHVNPGEVSKVRVVKHGSIFEFFHENGGTWHLAGADGRKLGTERVNRFFRNICGIKVLSFPENQNVPGSFDVTVELASTRGVQKLRLWKEGLRVYALSDYQRGKVEVSAPILKEIPSCPDDLLDRSIVDMAGGSVSRIAVKGKSERVFTMKGGVWHAGNKKVEQGAVLNDMVHALISMEYEDEYLMLPGEAGTGIRLRIYPDRGAAPFDIILYSQYYVAVGKRVFRINEGDMKYMKESLQKLLSEDQ